MFRIIFSWHAAFIKGSNATDPPSATTTEKSEVGEEGNYVTEAEKEEARNGKAGRDRAERRRDKRGGREKRAGTNGWHCSRWGPTLTLAFTPTSPISSLSPRPYSYFRQCQPGVAKIFRRMREPSIQNCTRKERGKKKRIHRAQRNCVNYAT